MSQINTWRCRRDWNQTWTTRRNTRKPHVDDDSIFDPELWSPYLPLISTINVFLLLLLLLPWFQSCRKIEKLVLITNITWIRKRGFIINGFWLDGKSCSWWQDWPDFKDALELQFLCCFCTFQNRHFTYQMRVYPIKCFYFNNVRWPIIVSICLKIVTPPALLQTV